MTTDGLNLLKKIPHLVMPAVAHWALSGSVKGAVHGVINITRYECEKSYFWSRLPVDPSQCPLLLVRDGGRCRAVRIRTYPHITELPGDGCAGVFIVLTDRHPADDRWIPRLVENQHGSTVTLFLLMGYIKNGGKVSLPCPSAGRPM